jgi:RNA polymerase primary sigma factor
MNTLEAYFRDIKKLKLPLLTADQEKNCAIRIRQGDSAARTKMINSNLLLVVSIAKKYSHFGVALTDLIEEGNMGLMKAVSMYNPDQRFRFSTYGAYWIRQYITRALANQAKTVRVPVYMVEAISKWKRSVESLTQKLGRRPRIKEVAQDMKTSIKKIRQIHSIYINSLEEGLPNVPDENKEIGKMINVLFDVSMLKKIEQSFYQEFLSKLLQKINEKERLIISLRFGLNDGVPLSLGEVADLVGCTRENIRQIQNIALKKLQLRAKIGMGDKNG